MATDVIKNPEYQDEVKQRIGDMTGTVIAKYMNLSKPDPFKVRLDIRTTDEEVHYDTAAVLWVTTRTREEIEGPPT